MEILNSTRLYFNEANNVQGTSLYEVYDNNQLSIEALKWYFEIGYVPGENTLFEGIKKIRPENIDSDSNSINKLINHKRFNDQTKSEIIDAAYLVLKKRIGSLVESSKKKVILPLTSGLDSRLILALLLEYKCPEDILTLTWGVPNTYDFDIAKKISAKLNIKHYALNLNNYKLTDERLNSFAISSDFSVPLLDHWPKDEVKNIVDKYNGNLWLGVLGGSLSGSNLPKSQAENPFNNFIQKYNRIPSISSLSASLLDTSPDMEDLKRICENYDHINYDNLDIFFHHQDLIAPTKIHKDLDYTLPFVDEALLSFFLSLPEELRNGREVFHSILLNKYYNLAKFPSNRNAGLGLHIKGKKRTLIKNWKTLIGKWDAKNKNKKYLSLKELFDESLISQEYIIDKLDSLEKRNFLNSANLNIIRKEFFEKNTKFINHGRAIDALISLEIFLQILERK